MRTETTSRDTRELALRAADGVEVTLLWHADKDFLSVTVFDATSGAGFELVLGDGENAMDVFHHPYAYAAQRGLEFHLPSRVSELVATV